MERPRSPEDWGKVFEAVRPTYVAFCERLEELLESRLDEEGISYHVAFVEVDSVDSFVERIYRAVRDGLDVGDPFEDLLDFARLELTAYSPEDLERIETLVRVELEVDEESSTSVEAVLAENEDLAPRPGDDRLGYQTARVVVSLPDSLARAWRAFGGLRAVIDIRTLMQDAWALFDQKYLPYYRHSSYPPEARRAIEEAVARCLEADNALAAVWYEIERADERYAKAIAEGDLDLPLDARSLSAYLRDSEVAAEMARIAVSVGVEPVTEFDPSSWRLEQHLLWLLRRAGIDSVSELDDWLGSARDRMGPLFSRMMSMPYEGEWRPHAHRDDLLGMLLLVLTRADARTVRLAGLRDEIEYALNTLIGNPVASGDEEE
jgi:ppGpp synthetase/RelA/SpoT-type nucleotidyltranferase